MQYAEALIHTRLYLVGDDLALADISVSWGFGIWQGALGGGRSRRRVTNSSYSRAA
jgi:glutathione S-transferase